MLITANDPPCGTERPYNALRLALKPVKVENVDLRLFLMADGVFCAIQGQKTPEGYYSVERMLKGLGQAEIEANGTCTEACGLSTKHLLPGIVPSNMLELTEWVVDSDKVITF